MDRGFRVGFFLHVAGLGADCTFFRRTARRTPFVVNYVPFSVATRASCTGTRIIRIGCHSGFLAAMLPLGVAILASPLVGLTPIVVL